MTYNIKKLSFTFLILFISTIMGCGIYSVRPGTIPPGIKSIAVEDCINETAEFGLGEKLTATLISRVLTENLLPIGDPLTAHSVIRTRITNITDAPHTFDETETVKEYKVSVTARFEWIDRVNDKEIMTGTITQWSVYYSDNFNNQLSPGDQIIREDGLDDTLSKLSQDIVEKLTSDW